jgi:hypothetical protein
MKVLCAFLLLAMVTLDGAAQQNAATNSASAEGQVSVLGCLTGNPGRYTVLTLNGDLYQLQGKQDFARYSGKMVRITGTKKPPKKAQTSNPNAAPSVLSTSPPRLAVLTIKQVEPICQ